MNAFLLQEASASPSRKLAISSGASGIRKSKFLLKAKMINLTDDDRLKFYKLHYCTHSVCWILHATTEKPENSWKLFVFIPNRTFKLRTMLNKKYSNLYVPVDCIDCHDSITTNVRMTVFQAGSNRRHQWLNQFGLLQLAQKSQCWTSNKLVRMLEILRTEK